MEAQNLNPVAFRYGQRQQWNQAAANEQAGEDGAVWLSNLVLLAVGRV